MEENRASLDERFLVSRFPFTPMRIRPKMQWTLTGELYHNGLASVGDESQAEENEALMHMSEGQR
jgi:hypothetical protein